MAKTNELGASFVDSMTAQAREVFVDIYVHSNKESNWDMADKLGLSEEASRYFSFTAGELKLTYLLDRTTGETTLHAVDGRKLEAVNG